HTSFSRDWSSDVCSSDLDQRALGLGLELEPAAEIDGQLGEPVLGTDRAGRGGPAEPAHEEVAVPGVGPDADDEALAVRLVPAPEIGRASGRERVEIQEVR